MRRISIIILTMLGLAALQLSAASADEAGATGDAVPHLHTFIALDARAAAGVTDLDMAETATRVIAAGQAEGVVTFKIYDRNTDDPRQYEAGSTTLQGGTDAIVRTLRNTPAPSATDQFQALSIAFGHLSNADAASGSQVYLVTPGGSVTDSESARERMLHFAGLFNGEGWQVNVVMLPSATADERAFMHQISSATGGRAFDTGALEGLSSLVNHAHGLAVRPAIEATLASDTPALAPIEAAPNTRELVVTFLRTASSSGISLFDPFGAPADASRASISVLEAPNAVIFTASNPAPGSWTARAVGSGSPVIAGYDMRSDMVLALVPQPPVPAGERGVLMAAATVDGEPVPLPGAEITATVRHPDGSASVYRLNDRGVGGDAVAGDGIFSGYFPASSIQGVNEASLELTWDNYNAVVRAVDIFHTEVFPVISVETIRTSRENAGTPMTVARLTSTVNGFPHLVDAADFTVVLTKDGREVAGHVTPRSLIDGRAWQFDVRAPLRESGTWQVAVTLNGEYVGRTYAASNPPVPVDAQVIPPVSVRTILLGLPAWMWGILGLLALSPFAIMLYASGKTAPYGYLFDDRDRLVADFNRVRRSWLRRMLFKDRVASEELPGLPFKGGAFLFTKEGVKLAYRRRNGDPSMRVNSRPAGPVTQLGRDVWLGVGGRLLTFHTTMRSSLSMMTAPSPADD